MIQPVLSGPGAKQEDKIERLKEVSLFERHQDGLGEPRHVPEKRGEMPAADHEQSDRCVCDHGC
jgi:hypothetical protein